jgi:predicted DNA binding CopG/RHH family protein
MRKEYDLSAASRASEVPHLAVLQTNSKGKSAVTLMLDDDVMSSSRQRASAQGVDCSTLLNQVLQQALKLPTQNVKPLR